MKRLFTLWVVLFVVLSAMAVPAKPGVWRTISLTDGTQVKVQLVGDEFMHYYQSADGTRYLYDAASATYHIRFILIANSRILVARLWHGEPRSTTVAQ